LDLPWALDSLTYLCELSMNDHELGEAVRKALFRDDVLSFNPIDVIVQDAYVTLRGTVQSYRRKARAEEIAASFNGCRGVINELLVEPPGAIADEDVARHVRSALDSQADLTPESIKIAVRNGKVTLSGHTASASERVAAEDIALSARGVRSVENLILVDPVEAVTDTVLAAEIQSALGVTRGLALEDIRIAIASNVAVLTGQVGELWQKEMAEKVVRRFGLLRVQNDIVVVSRRG